MLKELKARYWDIRVESESSPAFFYIGLREPKLRRAARFAAKHWQYFTGLVVTVLVAYFFR